MSQFLGSMPACGRVRRRGPSRWGMTSPWTTTWLPG